MQPILYWQLQTPSPHLVPLILSEIGPRVALLEDKHVYIEMPPFQTQPQCERALERAQKTASICCSTLTERAEWARALSCTPKQYFAPGTSHNALLRLPLDRLAWCGDPLTLSAQHSQRMHLIHFLSQLGLTTISDFVTLPTPLLEKRFPLGRELKAWVQGQRQSFLPWHTPLSTFQVTQQFESPLTEDMCFWLKDLVQHLESQLSQQNKIPQEMEILLCQTKGITHTLTSTFSTTRSSQSLWNLVRHKVLAHTLAAPLESCTLRVTRSIDAPQGQQKRFLPAPSPLASPAVSLEDFLAQQGEKLGKKAVGFLHPTQNLWPEQSWVLQPESSYLRHPPSPSTAHPPVTLYYRTRPLLLCHPPRPCVPTQEWKWEHGEYLDGEWWHCPPPPARRYWTVTTPLGEKLWVAYTSPPSTSVELPVASLHPPHRHANPSAAAWYIYGIFE